MRKRIIGILIILLLALFLFFKLFLTKMAPEIFTISNIDVSQISDGIYLGECDNQLVSAKVEVTVENGTITDIHIIEHENGKGEAANRIIYDVMDVQSLEVDAVSGATYSSNTILKAIENALQQKD